MRRLLFIFAMCLFTSLVWAQDSIVEQIEGALDQGQYRQALDLLQTIPERNSCPLQLLEGEVYYELGMPLAAREAFDRCLQNTDSEDYQAQAMAGEALTALLSEDAIPADRLLQQAINLSFTNDLVRLATAELALIQNNPDKALEVAEAFLESDKKNKKALSVAAIAQTKKGNTEQGYILLERLESQAGLEHPLSLITRYQVRLAHNDEERALPTLDKLNELLPAHVHIAADHSRLLLKFKDPMMAAQRLAPAIEKSPDLPFLLRLRAECYIKAAVPGRAAEDLELLVSKQKAVTLDYFLLAEAYRQMRNHKKWLELGELLEKEKPDSPDGPHLIGTCMDDLDNVAEAFQAYSRALARDPLYTPTLLARADLLLRQDRVEEARTDVVKALQINPADAHAKVLLASLEILTNENEKAEAILREVLQAEPDDLETQVLLSLVLERQGKTDEAARLNNQINSRQATSLEMTRGLASLSQAGKHDEVVQIANEYLQMHQFDFGVRAILVDSLVATKQYALALESLDLLISHWGGSRSTNILRATCLAETGQAIVAISLLDEVVAKHPDDLSALYRRGMIKQNAGDLDGALADFIQLARIDSEAAAPRLALVKLFLERKEYDRARAEAYLYLNRTALPCEGWRWRGKVELLAGDFKQAVEYFSRALALCADDREALTMRCEAFDKLGDVEQAKADRELLQRLEGNIP